VKGEKVRAGTGSDCTEEENGRGGTNGGQKGKKPGREIRGFDSEPLVAGKTGKRWTWDGG